MKTLCFDALQNISGGIFCQDLFDVLTYVYFNNPAQYTLIQATFGSIQCIDMYTGNVLNVSID